MDHSGFAVGARGDALAVLPCWAATPCSYTALSPGTREGMGRTRPGVHPRGTPLGSQHTPGALPVHPRETAGQGMAVGSAPWVPASLPAHQHPSLPLHPPRSHAPLASPPSPAASIAETSALHQAKPWRRSLLSGPVLKALIYGSNFSVQRDYCYE